MGYPKLVQDIRISAGAVRYDKTCCNYAFEYIFHNTLTKHVVGPANSEFAYARNIPQEDANMVVPDTITPFFTERHQHKYQLVYHSVRSGLLEEGRLSHNC